MGCNASKTAIRTSSISSSNRPLNQAFPPTSAGAEAGQVRKTSVPEDTPPQRRRLSVVNVDATGIVDENQDRGLIRMLEDKSALDFFASEGKKWSIATETDQDLHRRASFGDKSIHTKGHNHASSLQGFGFACKKGLKPVSPNQDSFLLLQVEGGIGIYGVFDGHGRGGHDVSNFVKDMLPKLILSHPGFQSDDLTDTLTYAFHETQRLLEHQTKLGIFNASTSGTTGTVVVFKPPNSLWVAHVGDSRCVLGLREGGRMKAIDMTNDHKPELPGEHQRIISSGGAVIKPPMDFNHRVYVKGQKYPGLAMSRSLGDLVGYRHAGISCTPDVSCYELRMGPGAVKGGSVDAVLTLTTADPLNVGNNHQAHGISDDEELSENSDDTTIPPFMQENVAPANNTSGGGAFILLCSDGVWEFISSQEAVRIASKFSTAKANTAAEELARVSWDRWMIEENGHVVDDITALVIHL
jgi:serine/threonine protein phosphatase PrpC